MSLTPTVITGSGGLGLGLGNLRSGLTVLAHGLFSQCLRLDEVDGDFVEVGGGHKRRDHGGERVRDLGEEDEGSQDRSAAQHARQTHHGSIGTLRHSAAICSFDHASFLD